MRRVPSGELRTFLRTDDGSGTYVIVTDVPLYQECLVHMGYRRATVDRFERSFPNSPSLSLIHSRFDRNLERIVRQSARLDPIPWMDAMEGFLERVEGTELDWFL